jgi:hypothetical protein
VKGEVNDHVTLVYYCIQSGSYLDSAGSKACNFPHIPAYYRASFLLKCGCQGQVRILLHHIADALPHTTGCTGYDYFCHFFLFFLRFLMFFASSNLDCMATSESGYFFL